MTFPVGFPLAFGGMPTVDSSLPPISYDRAPASKVVTDDQTVTLHTAEGVQLYQFRPDDYNGITWSRDQNDASRFDISTPPLDGTDGRMPEIVPWAHHCTVWDGERNMVLWTGPIQKIAAGRGGLTINGKDHAAYLSRTRNPITKRWDAADPAWIIGALWDSMIEAQGIKTKPIVRPDPEGQRYDYQVETDKQMLDVTVSDLVGLGARWAVVSGTPVIGPVSLDPIATLGEDDFIGEGGISLVRDGTAMFNDVIVRAPVTVGQAKRRYFGQNLQTIVNLDSMFGVSNVKRAAETFVQSSSAVRTRLELAPSTVLHPNAPVSIDQLMPSARFVIEAQGIRQLMELTNVEVSRTAGSTTVKVTMVSVDEKLELSADQRQPNVTLGSAGR